MPYDFASKSLWRYCAHDAYDAHGAHDAYDAFMASAYDAPCDVPHGASTIAHEYNTLFRVFLLFSHKYPK
jgi:hypothetical protein